MAVDIDPDKLDALMRLKPSLDDTAAFFKCSDKTIERYIKAHYDLTFVEFRLQRMVHTRHSLIRKALEKALGGDNTMLIFCLKNLCGWSDKHEVTGDKDAPLALTMNYVKKTKPITND